MGEHAGGSPRSLSESSTTKSERWSSDESQLFRPTSSSCTEVNAVVSKGAFDIFRGLDLSLPPSLPFRLA